MPVPVFGWSAGDIVVSIKILIHVGEALRESGGAKDQFAETSTWLDSFAHDLEKVREFVINSRDAKYTENLVQQIAIIDPQYKKFEDHIQKFDPSLSSNSSISFIKRSGRTLQWAVKELKGHVDGLKNSVSGPLTSINLLLNLQNLQGLQDIADHVQRLGKASDVADIKLIIEHCGNQLDKVDLSLVDLHSALETHRAVANAFKNDVHVIVSGNCDEIINAQSNLTTGILSAVEQTRSEALRSLNAISHQLEVLQQEHHEGNQNLRNLLAEQQISTLACQIHIENIEEILQGMRQEPFQG